jgi:hypothetical protein
MILSGHQRLHHLKPAQAILSEPTSSFDGLLEPEIKVLLAVGTWDEEKRGCVQLYLGERRRSAKELRNRR